MKFAAYLFLASLLSAQAHEDGYTERIFYARDPQTEIALSPPGPGSEDFEFHVYGDSREGRVIYDGGWLKKDAGGALLSGKVNETAFVIAGKSGDVVLKIKASGVSKINGGVLDLSGDYRKLTNAEALNRARRRFADADAALNADYQALRATLSAQQQNELRDSQRDWIEFRDSRAAWETRGAKIAKEFRDYWEELLSQTTTRLGYLKVYTGRAVPPGLSGEYGDFSGGSLSLELAKEGLRFSIEVVRGVSLHLGEISGLAVRKSDTFFAYREKVPLEEQSPNRLPAELTFTVVDFHRVRVVGKNTSAHHGARASFDGMYLKTGKLEKPVEVD